MKMKKIINILLVMVIGLFLSFAFSACGSNGADTITGTQIQGGDGPRDPRDPHDPPLFDPE